jgi:hypothetical protein
VTFAPCTVRTKENRCVRDLDASIKYIGAPDIQMIFNRERFRPEKYFDESIIKEATIVN